MPEEVWVVSPAARQKMRKLADDLKRRLQSHEMVNTGGRFFRPMNADDAMREYNKALADVIGQARVRVDNDDLVFVRCPNCLTIARVSRGSSDTTTDSPRWACGCDGQARIIFQYRIDNPDS